MKKRSDDLIKQNQRKEIIIEFAAGPT